MKHTKKRILSVATTAALLLSISAAVNAKDEGNIYLNNALLENTQIVEHNDVTMIPLRAVCENLGFTVNWIHESRTIELVKMPIYITCSPDRDGYTFSKTAPQLLGVAPQLIDDSTYVPTNFINEILQGEISEENGNIYINYGEEEVAVPVVSGTVCDMIFEDENLIKLVIGEKDLPDTQTILNLSEEMAKIATELGIEVGSVISAEVEDLATLSIPPQMIPVSLELVEADVSESTEAVEGVICDLVFEDEKLVQIVIGDENDPLSQTVLNLTEELAAKALELKAEKGMTLKGTASMMMTRSIPAQQPLVSIEEIK